MRGIATDVAQLEEASQATGRVADASRTRREARAGRVRAVIGMQGPSVTGQP